VLAAEVHADQRRKGTEIPYVAHVLAVTAIVLEHGGDEDEAIAALLHDAVEDGGGRPMLERIRNEFGERVAMIVDGCTDAYVDPKPPWAERKRAYLAELATADGAVVLVSAADKLHNATAILNDHRAVGDAVWRRFKATPEETAGYYVALAAVYRRRLPGTSLAEEIARVVDDLTRQSGVTPAGPERWTTGSTAT
jgi:(p)ppGpp synthase/HD superfamily hydrolase